MKTDLQLGAVFKEAMRIWDAQKAEGVSLPERLRGLEQTLRAAWPRGRQEPWRFNCEQCEDRGLVMSTCPGVAEATCGRERPHLAHDFGRPCWCEGGARFRPKAKPTEDDAVASAAKVSKPQKVGRW
jgi:hypothetical protein